MCVNIIFQHLCTTASCRLLREQTRAPANLLDPIAADTALLQNAFIRLRAATPRRMSSPPVDFENPLGAPRAADVRHEARAFLWSCTHPRCPSRRRSRDPRSLNGPAQRSGWHRCCLYEPSESAAELTSCDADVNQQKYDRPNQSCSGGHQTVTGPQSAGYDKRPADDPCACMSRRKSPCKRAPRGAAARLQSRGPCHCPTPVNPRCCLFDSD